jgi:hypothetical protein
VPVMIILIVHGLASASVDCFAYWKYEGNLIEGEGSVQLTSLYLPV